MNIQIRVSTPDDVYQIRDVQKNTWIDTYPNEENGISRKDIEEVFQVDATPAGKMKMEERKKRYQNPNLRTWVATDDGRIIGFCSAGKEHEKNTIHAIYLLPSYQGKGVGKFLLESAFAWLGKEKDVYVNVVQYNEKAIGFYKKMGFVETGKTGIFDTVSMLPSGKDLPEMELIIKK